MQVDGGTVGGEETEQGEGDKGGWWKRGWRNQKEERGPNIWVVVFQHLPMDSLSHLHRFLSATYHGLQPTKKVKLMSFFNTQNMCKSTALDWYTKHIVLCNLYKTHFFFYDTHGSIMAKLLTEFMRFDYNQILTVLLLVNDQNLINLLQFYKIYLPIKIYI